MSTAIQITPITGIGEIPPGTDLGSLIFTALQAQQLTLQQGDILVVTQKIVSKAEGRVVDLDGDRTITLRADRRCAKQKRRAAY